MGKSVLQLAVERAGAEAVVQALTTEQRLALQYEWPVVARPEQLPPARTEDGRPWLYWLLLAGRGFGKSRSVAEWARQKSKDIPGGHGAIISPTAADARDVMVKAVLAACPQEEGCVYEPSKRRIAWLNGSSATLYSAEEPDRLRGPQHHWAVADEMAAWGYLEEVFDMLMFGLRLGQHPQLAISTTPRPLEIIKRLLKDPLTVTTRGSTYDNAVNLAPSFINAVRERYDGTRLGRQELYAEVLDDVEGALWNATLIEKSRHPASVLECLQFNRVVVAVDPSGSAKKTADEAGIVVCAISNDCPLCKGGQHAFVLEDLSGRYSPADMIKRAVDAYWKWNADRFVAEDNFGGKIIEDLVTLTDRRVAYRAVHASKGKLVRAEPVAALYERGRVHHIGMHKLLEDQLCQHTAQSSESPGRLDAAVWGLTDLMLGESKASFGATPFKPPSFQFHPADDGDDD